MRIILLTFLAALEMIQAQLVRAGGLEQIAQLSHWFLPTVLILAVDRTTGIMQMPPLYLNGILPLTHR
jgi:hypothetical protein